MKIKVDNLCKTIKNNSILESISYEFESKKIYGIVGRNGSGKTVFLKILCGLYSPTTGSVYINDEKVTLDNNYKFNIGALIENPKFFNDLSGFENLKILADIKKEINEEKIISFLDMFSLKNDMNKKYGKYSLGMKQKLGIIQAIMEDQKIIILDEPFNGVEESTVKIIKDYLKEEVKKDKIIIITSHIKDDLENLVDKTIKFDNGKLIK